MISEVPVTAAPTWDQDIKPLFRDWDRDEMLYLLDLWSYTDVCAYAASILERVADGTMPCDAAWPQDQIDLFGAWVAAGTPQ
jgi:hypothetical protein